MAPLASVTAVMVTYHNEDAALERLTRDLLPSLAHYRDTFESEVVVIDNSAGRLDRLSRIVETIEDLPASYVWNDGRNLFYGPGLNIAVERSSRAILLYLCASHGRMRDPTWVGDLLEPILRDGDRRVGMAGSYYPTGRPSNLGFPDLLPWVHIQGGVFAARREVLAENPYPDGEFAHWGADVYQSLRLANAGYVLANVPSVKSVWRRPAEPGPWKYVHDEP